MDLERGKKRPRSLSNLILKSRNPAKKSRRSSVNKQMICLVCATGLACFLIFLFALIVAMVTIHGENSDHHRLVSPPLMDRSKVPTPHSRLP
jgi:hypothetical protein